MMKRRKECVAMLLAGGQGKRLMVLTEDVAKPAIPFGGKYRIIDFSLSNCVNSNIDTVGILTQYQPLLLNEYVSSGSPWGLNSNYGGAHILPPYEKNHKTEWYKGTANAIYQNIPFLDQYNPEYVVVLSGDHIYKMDYSKMLDFHKKNKADCTIAVLDVSLEEASRFGIMNTNDDDSIYEFEEKPEKPKSTKASMGVYIFNWEVLREYLVNDEKNPKSSNDFGKDIIPNLLNDQKRLFAYPFSGYWKDVGTIGSLWSANMDLISPEKPFDLNDPHFKIYARNYAEPGTYVSVSGEIHGSLAAEGCEIKGLVEDSIISTGCEIEEGATVIKSVIMPNTKVCKGAVIQYAIVGEETIVGKNCKIGESQLGKEEGQLGIAVVGGHRTIEDNTVLKAEELI